MTDVSWVRWYVLSVLCALTAIENAIWAGWGPIGPSAEIVYQWTDSDVYMMMVSSNGAFLLAVIPAMWFLFTKGIRRSVHICAAMTVIGAGLRCVHTNSTLATTIIIFLAQSIDGIAGFAGSIAPPLVSETWFPPGERTTATMVGYIFAGVGSAMSFILGPQLVKNAKKINQTDLNITSTVPPVLGFSLCVAICAFSYFPEQPKAPPSVSATTSRPQFAASIKGAFSSKSFWIVALASSVPLGVFGSWGANLAVSLKPFSFSETEAGWLSFFCNVSSSVFGIVIARFADKFTRKLKLFVLVSYALSIVFFLLFTLMCEKIVPTKREFLYILPIVGSMLLTGSNPMFYEIATELVHPISPSISAGLISFVINVSSSLVLLMTFVPGIGNRWMNWTLPVCIMLTVPLLIIFKEEYKRSDEDSCSILENKESVLRNYPTN